jgi:hypothetical protein
MNSNKIILKLDFLLSSSKRDNVMANDSEENHRVWKYKT